MPLRDVLGGLVEVLQAILGVLVASEISAGLLGTSWAALELET